MPNIADGGVSEVQVNENEKEEKFHPAFAFQTNLSQGRLSLLLFSQLDIVFSIAALYD